MNNKHKDIFYIILNFLLVVLGVFLSILSKELITNLGAICVIAGLVVLFSCITVFHVKRKESISKLLFILQVIVVFALCLAYFFHSSGIIYQVDTVEELRDLISKFTLAKYAYVALQFFQVVFLPIPSTVTSLAGLLLFSPWEVVLYSLLGIIPGSIVMFLFGKYAGRKALNWAIGKEQLDRYLTMIKGKDISILTATFFLPFFPDDTICAIAGLSSMKIEFFIPMIILSRFVTSLYTIFLLSGNLIPFHGWGLIVWAVLIVGVIAFLIFIWKKGIAVQEKLLNLFKRKKS